MRKRQNSIIQKVMFLFLLLLFGVQLNAQSTIELKSNYRGTQLSESSLNGFETVFSYSKIETELVKTEVGDFSKIVIANAVPSGEIGAPSLPVTRKLIAVPFGANTTVKVVDYTTTDYQLSDYGIERIYPQQPSYSKDTKMEDVEFQYNEKAYKTRSFNNSPEVAVELLGTMRGIQIASLQVEPISYNPSSNTLRIYNDIKLEVDFENADIELTKEILIDTYSPYFDVVYKQMFNAKTIADVFEEHPDLYRTPVYMTVVANSMFEEALQPWLEWKMQKGFYIDVKYVDETTSSSSIRSYMKEQYAKVRPSFLVIVGDKNKVAPSLAMGQKTSKVTDLYYGSIDEDYFPDIYYSRMSCETIAELEALVEKVLQYEKYTMPDPSYLSDALMIAGVDEWWNSKVGTPSINYATNFFFNQLNGLDNVHKYTKAPYTGCYNHMSEGVGFVNYTAHGVESGWVDPAFSTSDVSKLTNKDKYFWALGNCCLTGDWGSSNGPCLAEAMVRAKEKGAWGYVGSCPVTYWYEDYYFVVGATTVFDKMPNITQTEEGLYEMFWKDDVYNTLSSVPFVGNLSVTNAHVGAYQITTGIELLYYWEAYHAIGDGTVMPYRAEPEPNAVSHTSVINMGLNFYNVIAEPSSYVAISKDGVLLGTAMVDKSGSVNVPITPIVTDGEATIVVTHPRKMPYIKNVLALPTEGPYLSVYACNPENYPVNQECKMTLTIRNVGNDPINKEAKVTLTSDSEYITFVDSVAIFTSLESGTTLDLTDEYSFVIDKSLVNEDVVAIYAKIEYDTLEWNNKFAITVSKPVMEYEGVEWDMAYEPGGTYTLHAKFKNVGDYKAENAVVTASSSNEYLTFKNTTSKIDVIEVDGSASFDFEFTIDKSCSYEERIPVEFTFVADNDVEAEGSYVLKNSCDVVFTLKDSFGDGWGKSALEIKYSDGTPTDTISIFEGSEYVKEINIVTGTTVTVSFIKEKYNSYECSYTIEYKDGAMIYASEKNIKEGVNCEFVVNCIGEDDINEFSDVKFMIYPNPAKDVINVKTAVQRCEYQMINNLGQIVLDGVLSGENAISLGNIDKGVYFLKLIADGEVSINKVIIQ